MEKYEKVQSNSFLLKNIKYKSNDIYMYYDKKVHINIVYKLKNIYIYIVLKN